MAGGDFSRWGVEDAGGHLVRLRADGSRDGDYDSGPAFAGAVVQVLALPEGGCLVLGRRTEEGESRTLLQHRGPDGALDASFSPMIPPDAVINGLALARDSAVLLAGRFASFDGVAVTNLARLRPDLALDREFHSPAAATAPELLAVAAAADDRVAVGGRVSNPFPAGLLAVLQPDGETDPAFQNSRPMFALVTRLTFDGAGNLFVTEQSPAGGDFGTYVGFSPTGEAREFGFSAPPDGAAPFARSDDQVLWPLDGVFVSQANSPPAVWSWLLETLPTAR